MKQKINETENQTIGGEVESKVIGNNTEKPIPVKAIYKLEELKKYNKDFVRALLPKQEYKPSEAIQIIKNYFKEQ